MNKNLKKIKLTDKDKKIILNNSNICTDTHGKGCVISKEHDRTLN